jgi:D-arabinono-1,4-lactone oxidase
MAIECIPKGSDGFYHPASEEELVCLVKKAYHEGRELRVRGSAHSVSHAIYTDPEGTLRNHVEQQSPPPGDNLNVMLDRYISFRVIDRERRLVECDAGIHLGRDPSDPTHTSTLENSLLYQLWKDYGWTLGDTGGISHQTVSGFTATGSSGGSLQFSANENLYGFRMIDGTGEVYEASRDNDPDLFWAMSPNLGLLGVVSKMTLQCDETFNISGQEAITTVEDCSVDLFGAGDGRPTLEQFLKEVEYTRLEWWPQRGGERILVWQAQRMRPQLGFRPVRYEEFTDRPEAAELGISIFYTIIGNLGDLSRAKALLRPTWQQLGEALSLVVAALHLPEWVAKAATAAAAVGVDAFIDVLMPFAHEIQKKLPEIFPKVLEVFEPLDSTKKGMQKGEPQSFRDWAWQGLPMDNQASDVLVPTEFTEMWLPVQRATEVMKLLKAYFDEPEGADEALRRTGTYAWELYGAEPTKFWMNCSHSDGADEWKDGVFRVDVYWFANNPGDPAETFYPQFWQLLRDNGVPFRLHWGKFQPVYAAGDRSWVDFFRGQFPRWDDFLALRARKDPNNLFLTDYWRARFGLWDLPRPQPVQASVEFSGIAEGAPHAG